jgi:transmembrane sensor
MTSSTPKSPDQPEPWDALARYLAGESSPEEAATIRQWLDADPARAEIAATLQRSLGRVAFSAPADLDVEGALNSIKARRTEAHVIELRPAREPSFKRWSTIGLRVAAVVVLLLGGLVVWRAWRGPAGDTPSIALAETFTAPLGRVDTVALRDGSRVVLAPGSQLVVAAGFGKTERAVTLQGEALFDVQHDEASEFRVQAGGASIRDLGTTFTVRSVGGEEVVVAVSEGSVMLQSAAASQDSGVILRAGDRGVLSTTGEVTAQRSITVAADLAWTRGQLVFENAAIERVQTDLRRWYGTDLRIDPSVAGRTVTATFAGEPVEQVLNVIALTLGAEIVREGDTVLLRRAAAVRR